MLDALELNRMTDSEARRVADLLVQIIEAQAAEIATLKETVQQLRDEVARLKGEQGKPTIRPRPAGHSSEQERPADHRTSSSRGAARGGRGAGGGASGGPEHATPGCVSAQTSGAAVVASHDAPSARGAACWAIRLARLGIWPAPETRSQK